MTQSILVGTGGVQTPSTLVPPFAESSSVVAVTGQKKFSRSFMSPVRNTGIVGVRARSRLTWAASICTAWSRHFWAGPRTLAGLWVLRK